MAQPTVMTPEHCPWLVEWPAPPPLSTTTEATSGPTGTKATAAPIRPSTAHCQLPMRASACARQATSRLFPVDRKSTRLNSSHGYISYAVFCLKKKKKHNTTNLEASTPETNSSH